MIHLTILVTNECNLSCRYCFSISNICQKKELLTVKNAISIINNIDFPISSISLSGGEPLLHPELVELYFLFEQKYPTWITTNGTIYNYDIFKKLASSNGINITVSLNAINQNVDYLLRGTHCKVENIVSNIQALSTISESFKVNTIVSGVNLDEVYAIGKLLTRLNARGNMIWKLLQVTINSNVIAECSDLLISEKEFRLIISRMKNLLGNKIHINSSTSAELESNCFMVNPSGDIFNLKKSIKPIGNIMKDKLSCIV